MGFTWPALLPEPPVSSYLTLSPPPETAPFQRRTRGEYVSRRYPQLDAEVNHFSSAAPDGTLARLNLSAHPGHALRYIAAFACNVRQFPFCGTFLRVTSTGRYPASCPSELGLSSRPFGTGDRLVYFNDVPPFFRWYFFWERTSVPRANARANHHFRAVYPAKAGACSAGKYEKTCPAGCSQCAEPGQ